MRYSFVLILSLMYGASLSPLSAQFFHDNEPTTPKKRAEQAEIHPHFIGRWSLIIVKNADLIHNDASLVPGQGMGILTISGNGEYRWENAETVTTGQAVRMIPPKKVQPEVTFWKLEFNGRDYYLSMDPGSKDLIFISYKDHKGWVASGKRLP